MTTKSELLKSIKFQCQECMGSSKARKKILDNTAGNLVDGCSAPECPLFEYRNGIDPRPSRKGRSDWNKKT